MDRVQRGVAVGMAAALVTAAVILIMARIIGGLWFASGASPELRARVLAGSVLAPAIVLLICIARLARHRFFTPDDIDGSALTEGTSRAKLLQALLQNTLEQLVLASVVYVSCAIIYPARFLGAIPAAAAMFVAGRILFFARYSRGAASRAFGFALTFYPTVFLASAAVVFLIAHDVS